LIVTCDECSTSFELDESRIPVTGARVRCSRCKHAFFLPNPTASATDAADSIAEEVAGDETAGVPTASRDLAGLDGSVASEANPPESSPVSEPEEEEWQFTEEIRVEGDDDLDIDDSFGDETDFTEEYREPTLAEEMPGETSDSPPVDASDEGVGLDASIQQVTEELEVDGIDLDVDDDPSGLELGGAADAVSGIGDAEESATGVEAGHDDSSFGAVEDFSALSEEVDLDGVDTEPTLNADLSDDSDAGLYSSEGSTEDLGDPENWDLAPGADFDSQNSSIAGLVNSFSSPGSQAAGRGSASTFENDLDPNQYDPELGERSMLTKGLASIASIVGWVGTVAAVSVVAYLGITSESKRWSIETQSFAQGSLTAQTTHSRWIETLRSEPLLVVDGIARNTGAEGIDAPSLQIALLDAEGNRIPGAEIVVGSPLAEEILREATPDELGRSKQSAPGIFRSSPLTPGESRPFQAVIGELPLEARRLLLEAVADDQVGKLARGADDARTRSGSGLEGDSETEMAPRSDVAVPVESTPGAGVPVQGSGVSAGAVTQRGSEKEMGPGGSGTSEGSAISETVVAEIDEF
jgi:predicted Zn finger-like uncharacterized protein